MGVKNKNIEDFYPLSPMQQGILYHSLATPQSGTYFEQLSWTLYGKLNITAFHRAWQNIVERHSILRTCFVWQGLKEPVQVVHRQVTLPWQEYNWQHLSLDEQQQKLEVLLESDRSGGLELTQPPLMRFTLVQLSDTSHNFIWSHHHLLLDGWSVAIIFKEVLACYKAFSNSEDVYLEPIRPYRDYIVWLQQQNLSEAEAFWRETLKGFTTPTRLWADRGDRKSLNLEDDYTEQEIQLSAVTTAALKSIAQQHQLTLNTLVQGAWALLLSCYSGQEDVVFGTVTSGRPPNLAKAESMVGLFINTLPIRVKVSPKEFLLPWLQKIKDQVIEARQYEYTPLVKVQAWSEVPKGLSLFESIVVFQNYAVDTSVRQRDINFEIEDFHSFERTNYPITLMVSPDEELSLKISCNDSDRSDTVTRMLRHLQTLLEGIVINPQQRVCELSLLTETERHQLLVEWNNTEVDYPQQQSIHQLFEAQVERTPDAVAVVFEDEQLTYCELNTRANQLAHYLRSLGVKPEVLVGICVERSLSMVIALLAILKAGGAYLPLDPNYPKERLAFMLSDACVPVLLTQQRLVGTLPADKAKVICLDTDWNAIAQENQENPLSLVKSDNLAYVNYTSGSTGKPKGVEVLHRGVIRLLFGIDYVNLDTTQRILQMASISFDAFTFELWGALLHGARCVLFPGDIPTPKYLSDILHKHEITTLWMTAALFNAVIDDTPNTFLGIQQLLIGGEALSVSHVLRAQEILPSTQIINGYGPTESTTFSCCYPIPKELDGTIKSISIGCPIGNTQVYLLDAQLQPVPIGVTGELYIGGAGLARGYLNRPELTTEKFIPNPFSDELGSRLYKSGDLARYLPSGNIEYIGRIDNQVKIRGFRIEIGEIEALITQHPAVRETVVVVREDSADSKNLVAYVVAQREQTLTISELRSFLESKLPNYMIPAAFVTLEALPLTPNGKVDRKSLPAPDTARPQLEAVYQPPQTEAEKTIANLWQEVLNIEDIGIHDNFFELGGNSLLLVQVHSKLQKTFQRDFLLVEMFQYPTINLLARYFSQESTKEISFIKNSHAPEDRTASLQRRKQARKEHRTAIKEGGISFQSGEQN